MMPSVELGLMRDIRNAARDIKHDIRSLSRAGDVVHEESRSLELNTI